MFGPFERDAPRNLRFAGVHKLPDLQLKMYELNGAPTDRALLHAVLAGLLARVAKMGDSNGLGFVIVHPGSAGLTVNAYWWAQGSVLCQSHMRQPYGQAPLGPRPVVGCVWELAVMDFESRAWRRHMMGDAPDAQGYLADIAATAAA